MPTYQYACTECEHSFEQVQSFSDDSLTVCPRCEGRLRKIFNAAAVVFKGSGFYRTDSRAADKADAAAATSSNGSTSTGDSSTSGSGDAKSGATKTDTPAAKPAKVAAATNGSTASKPKAGSTSAA